MFSISYMMELIQHEVKNPNHVEHAITVFKNLLSRSNDSQIITIFELSEIISGRIGNDELYKIGFELSSLSVPVFSVIIEIDISGNKSLIFEQEEIYNIMIKKDIANPDNGEVLNYSTYKDHILFLFKSNKKLFIDLKKKL